MKNNVKNWYSASVARVLGVPYMDKSIKALFFYLLFDDSGHNYKPFNYLNW